MRVRLKSEPGMTGFSDQFNVHAMAEVIVGWDGEMCGMDSCYIDDLEVETLLGVWTDMGRAFKRGVLVTDNYNRYFHQPRTQEERARGYYL